MGDLVLWLSGEKSFQAKGAARPSPKAGEGLVWSRSERGPAAGVDERAGWTADGEGVGACWGGSECGVPQAIVRPCLPPLSKMQNCGAVLIREGDHLNHVLWHPSAC